MSGNMTVMQYANKFMELSRFVTEFMSFERLKMRRFDVLHSKSVSWATNLDVLRAI